MSKRMPLVLLPGVLWLIAALPAGAQPITVGGCTWNEDSRAGAGISARCADPDLQRVSDGLVNDCYRSANPSACLEKYLPSTADGSGGASASSAGAAPRALNPGGSGLWQSGAAVGSGEIDKTLSRLGSADHKGSCANVEARRRGLLSRLDRYRSAIVDIAAAEKDIAANGSNGHSDALVGSLAGVFTGVKGAADTAIGGASLVNPAVNELRERFYNKAKTGVALYQERGAGKTIGNTAKLAGEVFPADLAGNNPFALKTAGSGVKAIAYAVEGKSANAMIATCDAMASMAKESGASKIGGSRLSAACNVAGGVKNVWDGAGMVSESLADAEGIRRRTESSLRSVGGQRARLAGEIEKMESELRVLESCLGPQLYPSR